MKHVEGMKPTPAGGANRAPFNASVSPSNTTKAVGGLGKMLSAIKHIGKPESGKSMPFA